MCAGEPGAGSQQKELYASADRGRTWSRGRVPGIGYLEGLDVQVWGVKFWPAP